MGRSGVANIRNGLAALEHSKSHPFQDNVIIDAEKAFDNINLDCPFRVMGAMGF